MDNKDPDKNNINNDIKKEIIKEKILEENNKNELIEKVFQLELKLKEKEKEISTNFDKYLRSIAELENYKKRASRDKIEYLQYSQEKILKDFLNIFDNIERAVKHTENSDDFTAFIKGLILIKEQFQNLLLKYGIKPIETNNCEFDPNLHEAVLRIESKKNEDNNKVVEEFEKGYLLNGRLLRAAKVSVAKYNKNHIE